MNIPMSWLKTYVDINCDMRTFTESMTLSGSKVEKVEYFGREISNVVVGKVLQILPHPNADKLVITQIDIGRSVPVQIVTGATNLYEGAYVPVALDGATLANDVKIKSGSLRGELSDGMLCSIEELGYTKTDYPESPENGIYIFTNAQELGADVRPILELCDEAVEFEVTSNRTDCFSVLGLAREAAVTFGKPFRYPEINVAEKASGNIAEMISVEIKNPTLCPRYIARVVKNVKIEPSPQWMRHRLITAGMRPVNNIVDITNYVMLELGQPMHAFDIEGIDDKKIIVRNAEDGEIITTLDGTERKLDSAMLVIADKNKAVAVAGVMGGQNSRITGTAGAVLFESANFNGVNVRLTSKKLGLRTDASGKYEKGLDPNLALEAVNRAVQLVELLNCGEVVKGVVDCYPNPRTPWEVNYKPENINRLLGTNVPAETMEQIFAKLSINAKNGVAQIPTFRGDITCEADLAEEVARIFGYDNIPVTLASGTPTVGKKSDKQMLEEIVKDTMTAQGYCESLTYAFESPKVFEKLQLPKDSDLRKTVTISNPLGEDFSIMRTTTINAMLTSLSTNYNKRNEEAALFELAKTYEPKSLPLTEQPNEIPVLTIGMYGKKDYYDIKGAVEALAERLGIAEIDFSVESTISYMHPGRTAKLACNGKYLGYIGEVHPAVLESYSIGAKTYVAVILTDVLFENANLVRSYSPIPKFPAIKRDIAMIVKDEVLVKEIESIIKENGGQFLESVKLFDVYKGQNLKAGHKSVAYSISFRAPDKTLTDNEVVAVMKEILENLESKLDAQLRDK